MFAPRYFGVRHFAQRFFAPGIDEEPETGGGGSGVSRLAGYFSRPVTSTYRPSFFTEVPKEERKEIERVVAKTPEVVIEAIASIPQRKKLPAKNRLGALLKTKAPEVTKQDIDEIVRHFEMLRRLEWWRRDEEDIALLLLLM